MSGIILTITIEVPNKIPSPVYIILNYLELCEEVYDLLAEEVSVMLRTPIVAAEHIIIISVYLPPRT